MSPLTALTAPAAVYVDPARYASERTNIFGRSWLFMAHESELARQGDAVSAIIAGYPLLVVKTTEGLKAFHNVCRHRAGPLFTEDRGNCGNALTCKYHGWTYTLDGRLRSARDFGVAPGFDVRDFGLYEVAVQTWRGLVFVNAGRDVPSLAELLAPLAAKLGSRELGNLVHAERRVHDIACNWKIYVENYLEGYHIPLVHPQLNADVDALKYRVTVEGAVCFHEVPPVAQKVDAVYDGIWAFIHPHLGFNSYGRDGFMMERMVPMGLSATRLVYDYYLTPEIAASATDRHRILSMSAIVTAEDKVICEHVQSNIAAGIYETGVLSPKHEAGIAWFQAHVAACLAVQPHP
jgi:choline monooxygenase